jgi:hypothetical protein
LARLFVQSLQDEQPLLHAYWTGEQQTRGAAYSFRTVALAILPEAGAISQQPQQSAGQLVLSIPLGGEGGRSMMESSRI